MATTTVRTMALAVLLTALTTQAGIAQDVQYRTVTKIDLGTGMNLMLKLAGASEVSETSYLKGKKLRTDVDKTSTIYDLDAGRYIVLNHDQKTYVSVPLGQMAAGAAAMLSGVRAEADQGRLKATAQDSLGNTADFTFDLKVEPTGERQKINGQDAERVLATMETDVKVTPEGETTAEDAGKLIVLLDVWKANAGPAYAALQNFHQDAAQEVVQQAFGGKSFSAAAADPKMAAAMKKAAEESQKLEGLDVRTTMYMVMVAPGAEFDRDLVLKPQAGGGGVTAKRAAGGLLRGALGAKKEEEPKPEQVERTQGNLMKVVTEIRDVQTKSLSASLFEIPSGYREIAVETGGN